MLRFARFALERASLKLAAAGGASLVVAVGGTALYIRQYQLQHHPLCTAALDQLQASQEGQAVGLSGHVGGYVDRSGGTAVLSLPVQTAGGGQGHMWVEAEAHVLVPHEKPSPLDFSFGVGRFRWALRHVEYTKEFHVPNEAQVLHSTPPLRPLPSWAPRREPTLPWSMLSREAQAFIPSDTSMLPFACLHLLGVVLIFGWLRSRVHAEHAAAALEAMIRLEPKPGLIRLRHSALSAAMSRAPVSASILDTPAKLTPTDDEFYGGVFGREVGAYTRVNSPTGAVDLLIHAVQRDGPSGVSWDLVGASIVDPRETEKMLADTGGNPDRARSAVFAMASAPHRRGGAQ